MSAAIIHRAGPSLMITATCARVQFSIAKAGALNVSIEMSADSTAELIAQLMDAMEAAEEQRTSGKPLDYFFRSEVRL